MPLHPDFQKILDQFKARYGAKKGTGVFYAWVNKRKLDYTKAYAKDQLLRRCSRMRESLCNCPPGICAEGPCRATESFQWAKPLIRLFKQDKEAKYYEVEAHFAVSSMNKNLYTLAEVLQAVHTLPGTENNLNHVTEWKMEGVTNMAANWEDGAVECILRVANGARDSKGRDIQDAIDSGEIDCVSVEVEAETAVDNPAGEHELVGMKYTGLALLDQEALPGIPLTRIMPLERLVESFFSEMESLENKIEKEVKETLSEETEAFGDASFPDSCFAYVPDSAKGPDGRKSDRKLPYKNKDGSVSLPHVRNALARLNQTQDIPAAEKDKIQKKLQNILGRENPDYTPTEAVAVFCPLCGKALAEGKCVNADCGANGKSVLLSPEELAQLNEKLSSKDTALAEMLEKTGSQGKRIEELEDRSAKDRAKLKELEGRLRETEQRVSDRNKRIDELEKDEDGLREDIGKMTVARESAISEKNEALAKAARDAERANKEIEERARIQRELADIREKHAGAVRREGEAAQKCADDAGKLLDQETEIKNLKEEIKKREVIIGEQQKSIEKALQENKRVFKILKANGIYEIDEQGNLKIPQ